MYSAAINCSFFFQISQPIVHCALVLFTFYACTCSSTQISSPSHICFFCLFSSIRDHTSIDIFSRYFAHFFCTHLYMDVVLLCDIDIYLWFVICYPSYLLFPFYIFFWSERLPERWCEWCLNTSMSTPCSCSKYRSHIILHIIGIWYLSQLMIIILIHVLYINKWLIQDSCFTLCTYLLLNTSHYLCGIYC